MKINKVIILMIIMMIVFMVLMMIKMKKIKVKNFKKLKNAQRNRFLINSNLKKITKLKIIKYS